MLVRDNQQATAWFVGILEGEGYFQKRESSQPRITVTNTDFEIIQYCKSFLTTSLILFSEDNWKPGKHKIAYRISISGQDVRNLYTRIGNQVQCRRQEFQHIIGAPETECEISSSIDWLVGFWEAEGSFFISQNHRENYTPHIDLENCNEKAINRIVLTLKSLGLSWYVREYERTTRKSSMRIELGGMRRCLRFLIAMKGLWKSKRNIQRTSLMEEFIQSRFSDPRMSSPYTDREHQIYQQMLSLNT